MGGRQSVLQVVLDLRIKARELRRQSDRCYRECTLEREKVRRALLKNNQEGARIFAQNYIRKQQEALNCLHMSSKLEAVSSRVDGAHRSRQLTTKIHSVASGLSGVLRKLDGSASLREIELFSKLFDDLDVRSDSVSSLLNASTSSAMPAGQVDGVLMEVAKEHRIPLHKDDELAEKGLDQHQKTSQLHLSENLADTDPYKCTNYTSACYFGRNQAAQCPVAFRAMGQTAIER